MASPPETRDAGPPAATSPVAADVPVAAAAWIREIGLVTTSRADAGIYRPLLRALAAEPKHRITCFAGGTHHAPQFGHTVDHLADPSSLRLISVHHFVEGDGPVQVARTAGRAMIEFSQAFSRAAADIVFLLGDRTEMLAAALAATIHTLPIAHLHGGDVTEGAYDNQCRHAITKLAHVHFPALPRHAERIRAMGEEPWRIHTVGALALDELCGFEPEPIEELSEAVGLDLSQQTIILALHPETLADESPAAQVDEVLAAVRDLDSNLLIVGTNADVGHNVVDGVLRAFAAHRSRTALVPSLSQARFWSCLSCCKILVGNSSAGILEAASFKVPVVNVGHRQAGRVRPANVIDAATRRDEIAAAIDRALDPAFYESISNIDNPYGNGRAAPRILRALCGLPHRDALLRKRWPTAP